MPLGKTNICVAIREQQNAGYLPTARRALEPTASSSDRFMGCSAFAEALSCRRSRSRRFPPDAARSRRLACSPAGLSTGLAAIYRAQVNRAAPCVVFGAGMVGLGAMAGCRLEGAERIICVDPSEDRRELARRHGATDTWPAYDGVVERVLEATDGFGADFTFEATGLVDVMRQAVESARSGGASAASRGRGRRETVDIVPRVLITGRTVVGASFGGLKGVTSAAARRPLPRG